MRKTAAATFIVAAALLAFTSLAPAQPGPAASASGPSRMMQGGGCCGPGWRAGPRNTAGWSLMTQTERDAHHEKMRSMKSADECRAYMDQHHAQMSERAKERGKAMPARPRRDPCAGFKPA